MKGYNSGFVLLSVLITITVLSCLILMGWKKLELEKNIVHEYDQAVRSSMFFTSIFDYVNFFLKKNFTLLFGQCQKNNTRLFDLTFLTHTLLYRSCAAIKLIVEKNKHSTSAQTMFVRVITLFHDAPEQEMRWYVHQRIYKGKWYVCADHYTFSVDT